MVKKEQLLKGILEGCVLEIISRGETYGYEITNIMNKSGFFDLNEGSIYPILIRLEKYGYVISESKASLLGPNRKYFTITTGGKNYLVDFRKIWDEISGVVDGIMKGGLSDA